MTHCDASETRSNHTKQRKREICECTLAHIGEAIKCVADGVLQSGDTQGAIVLYVHAAKAYAPLLTDLNKIQARALPAALASAAVVFHNIADYPQALQICTTYQLLGRIRPFMTQKTDAAIDMTFTKAGQKIRAIREG